MLVNNGIIKYTKLYFRLKNENLSWDRILHCWNQTQVKHCINVAEILEDQLIDFLYLQELSWGTNLVITIILTHIKPSTLPSIMTLGKFLQHAAQFHLHCCFDIKEHVFFHFRFALGR